MHAVLGTMMMFKVRRVPVVSDTGDVEGMISIDDIILRGTPRRASARTPSSRRRDRFAARGRLLFTKSPTPDRHSARSLFGTGRGVDLTDACGDGEAR